jgi:uncharacterized protein YjaG (DUF416 family)
MIFFLKERDLKVGKTSMTYQEFTSTIQNQISLLSPKRQLELAIKICKELFFEYQNFSEFYKWGNPDLLLDGINLSEKALNDNMDLPKIKELIPKIDSVTPDMDDFGSELASYALNASASVYEALEFLIDGDTRHVVNICTYYTDTVDFKVQEEAELTEEQIDKHPLMIKARRFLLTETK